MWYAGWREPLTLADITLLLKSTLCGLELQFNNKLVVSRGHIVKWWIGNKEAEACLGTSHDVIAGRTTLGRSEPWVPANQAAGRDQSNGQGTYGPGWLNFHWISGYTELGPQWLAKTQGNSNVLEMGSPLMITMKVAAVKVFPSSGPEEDVEQLPHQRLPSEIRIFP